MAICFAWLWCLTAWVVSGVLVSDDGGAIAPAAETAFSALEVGNSARAVVAANPCAKCIRIGDAKEHKGPCTLAKDGWCSTADNERYCSLPSEDAFKEKVKTCEDASSDPDEKVPTDDDGVSGDDNGTAGTASNVSEKVPADDDGVSGDDNGKAGTASNVSAKMGKFLKSLKNQSTIRCDSACVAFDDVWQGEKLTRAGDVTTLECKCAKKGPLVIQCTGEPFGECCKDKCEDSDCPDRPKGWTCPAKTGCGREPLCKEWVAAHNIFRCMHDVPALEWSSDVYASTKDHFANVKVMEHSKSYDVPPPAGPAGENLMQGTGTYNPMDVVSFWHSEVKDCSSFPGCLHENATGDVGHLTALVWQGAQVIGCTNNSFNLWACRLRGHTYKSCNTPNYGDATMYRHNVFKPVKDEAECAKRVKEECGLPVQKSNYDPEEHVKASAAGSDTSGASAGASSGQEEGT